KVNVALVSKTTPLGPPLIWVSGGVLSTMTTRVVVARFPARSVAVAVSVWLPSGTVVVFHVVAAVNDGAGGVGGSVAARPCVATSSGRVGTPLPLSVACACTLILSRTYAPAGGAWNVSVGRTLSCVIDASACGDVSPSPPWVVAKTVNVLSAFDVSVTV